MSQGLKELITCFCWKLRNDYRLEMRIGILSEQLTRTTTLTSNVMKKKDTLGILVQKVREGFDIEKNTNDLHPK